MTPPGEMPPPLVQFLLGGQTCVVATVDEQGRPMTTLMTWVVARNPQTLTLAVDTRAKSLRNMRTHPQVAIEVLGDDLCYGLRGMAVIEKEQMQFKEVDGREWGSAWPFVEFDRKPPSLER